MMLDAENTRNQPAERVSRSHHSLTSSRVVPLLPAGHVHLKEGEVVKYGWTVEGCRALDEYRA